MVSRMPSEEDPIQDPIQETVQDTQEASTEIAGTMETAQEAEGNGPAQITRNVSLPYTGERPRLIKNAVSAGETGVVPCVEAYAADPDLGNVDNLWQFYMEDGLAQKLSRNGFVVHGDAGSEFFNIYEENRYMLIPNFVTVDSLMHTYHLYFGHLLKNTERMYLSDSLMQLSSLMLEDSLGQYEQLKGTNWEDAARRNTAFFAVGLNLLGGEAQVDGATGAMAEHELDCISQAQGISESVITGELEDYSQYKPRGYYEGDEKLERYFKAMMWYGRIHFSQEDEDMDRSALLITKAFADDPQAYRLWEAIYAVTSFFAGASDDAGVCEYAPLMQKAYGDDVTVKGLAENTDAFLEFHAMTGALPAPQINSIPIEEGDNNVISGFRFMGQRFTIDASVMQKLIYSSVKENSAGAKRMLPDVLDVPAALGSDTALGILEENGAADFAGYTENMEALRKKLSGENKELWSASLYAGWLNTLRPLLLEKGEGYPVFMQSREWAKKSLECFAGSFTELKHDTILYSKQVMAEMGGGYDEEPDDRGYVEPEPLVYTRFADLADQTLQGLEEYGMLRDADRVNLQRLSQIAGKLLAISNKELQDELLSEEEYEFIKTYGGNIEHFWYEAVADDGGDEVYSQAYPAAVVVDIATNPNGEVLEAATGNPSMIYVLIKVDGKLKIARGSVYSFYQFPWPIDDRLTDSEWRVMMGLQVNENGEYQYGAPVEKPEWTESYRFKYEWE